MNSYPLISVIIPVFNVENNIEYMLNSVMQQSYRNIEIIVVDDGSKDNSVNVAKGILSKGDLMWTVLSKENGGAASARNYGIANSNGEWIICPDSDDYLAPQLIEIQLKEALEAGSKCAFSNFQSATVEMIKSTSFYLKSSKTFSANKMQRLFLERKMQLISPGLLIHKDIAKKIKYNTNCPYDEDVHYVWQVLFLCPIVTFLDCNYYLYIKREGSTVHSLKPENYLITSNTYRIFEKEMLAAQPENKWIIIKIHPKYMLGGLHVLAKTNSFDDFKTAVYKDGYRRGMFSLVFYPDFKLSLYALIYCVSLRLFYDVSRR
jgi:glycosyltransferase involved in cell wall biosynthesis